MGFNTLLTGVGTIISFWVIGKIIKPHNRVKGMLVATIILLVASALPAVNLNPTTIIVFSFINAFFTQFILNSSSSIFFLLIQKKAENNAREEYFSIRELLLDSGQNYRNFNSVFVSQRSGWLCCRDYCADPFPIYYGLAQQSHP